MRTLAPAPIARPLLDRARLASAPLAHARLTRGLLALALLLPACLENEEEITIRPDRSASIEIRAKGEPKDLASGYPVPLDPRWTAANAATVEWMRAIGPDTGSAAVRANVAALAAGSGSIRADQEVQLAVRAEFRSVDELPRFSAPESEPYRTAYLERTADLRSERKGGRTVYVFERAYRARTFERHDIVATVKSSLDEKVFEKIEKEELLSDAERAQVVDAAVGAMRRVPEAFATDALLSLYTQGDASLSPASSARALQVVRDAIARVVTRERLERIVAQALPSEGEPRSDDAGKDLEQLEKEVRETLRASFDRAFEAEGLPAAARNALRGELEWLLTARDHTDDLGDEKFHVTVRMPGTIVGGDYDSVEGGAASWNFDGGDLRDRDRVLRVVSVVE